MNITINNKLERIYDLYEQIFDYFLLTYYDLNSEIENKYSVNEFKNKLETFSDKHFLSAINDFNNEIISSLKSKIKDILIRIK